MIPIPSSQAKRVEQLLDLRQVLEDAAAVTQGCRLGDADLLVGPFGGTARLDGLPPALANRVYTATLRVEVEVDGGEMIALRVRPPDPSRRRGRSPADAASPTTP